MTPAQIRQKNFRRKAETLGYGGCLSELPADKLQKLMEYVGSLGEAVDVGSLPDCAPASASDPTAFPMEALAAMCGGDTTTEYDYVNNLGLDISFSNNAKAKCVYDKLIGHKSNFFKDALTNQFGSSPTSHVKFYIANLGGAYDGIVRPTYGTTQDNTANYRVFLDESFVNNASSIEIARTLMHELAHAELLDRCVQACTIDLMAPIPNSFETIFTFNGQTVNSGSPSFLGQLIDYYRNLTTNTDWNHNMMAASNYNHNIALSLVEVHHLFNDPLMDFLTAVNTNPANVYGNFSILQAMEYVAWYGFEATEHFPTEIQSVPAELNKMNYISSAAHTKYNPQCLP